MKSTEERAKEAGIICQYKSDYRYDKRSVEYGYTQGAYEQKAIDEEVRLKKCDDMTEAEYEREVAFAEWYHQNGKGIPTYSDAIEWARRELIDEARQWITEHIDIPYEGEFINDSPVASDYIEWCENRLEYAKEIADAFRKAMEE